MSGSSRQLTLKRGARGDKVLDLLCTQLASYLERGPLVWMSPCTCRLIKNLIMIMMKMNQIYEYLLVHSLSEPGDIHKSTIARNH